MGTSKSAVSRLEAIGRLSPSVGTLKNYARAVGCEVEIRLAPGDGGEAAGAAKNAGGAAATKSPAALPE